MVESTNTSQQEPAENMNNLEQSANSLDLALSKDSSNTKIEMTSNTSMAAYIDEITNGQVLVNHGEIDTTVFDEWLASDLAGYITEGDEDKYFFSTSEDASVASNEVSPLLSSSNLTTPPTQLGFDGVNTPRDLIDSPLFGSGTASFSGSPLDPVIDYFPDLSFSELAFPDITDARLNSSLIKIPSATAALTIPTTIPDTSSSPLAVPMSAVSSALNIPWDANITSITPNDETASSFVSAILNVKANSARTRPFTRTANTRHPGRRAARTSTSPISTQNMTRRPLSNHPSISSLQTLSATPETTKMTSPTDFTCSPAAPDTTSTYSSASPPASDISIASSTASDIGHGRKRSLMEVQGNPNLALDELAVKRAKNTDAARRSRLRKVLRMEGLEKEVTDLKTETAELQTRVAVLESEKKGLEEKNAEKDTRVRQLEQQLSEAHQRLINKI